MLVDHFPGAHLSARRDVQQSVGAGDRGASFAPAYRDNRTSQHHRERKVVPSNVASRDGMKALLRLERTEKAAWSFFARGVFALHGIAQPIKENGLRLINFSSRRLQRKETRFIDFGK